MNYNETLEYIASYVWKGSVLGLSRIRDLLEKLGNPQKELKFIHIAGTNGKGSTAAFLSSILKESGYKVGLFTSPYIEVFNERMQIDNENISDTSQHQHRNRIIDHRLVINRHQLLTDALCDRIQSRTTTSC